LPAGSPSCNQPKQWSKITGVISMLRPEEHRY
jgi:hypothetical protein